MTQMQCPLCLAEIDSRALVCPTCNRDVAIPAHLVSERAQLLRQREAVRAELIAAKAKLGQRRAVSAASAPSERSGED